MGRSRAILVNRAAGRAAARGTSATPAAEAAPERVTFRQVFAIGEFRALWLALILSVAGDQLARVAMTVLVYQRTRSPLLTALTYAMTFLPWVVGGVALSGFADRLPRRQVMIACDVARMVLVCLMAALSLLAAAAALWVMVALLFVVTLLDSPFKSARSALFPDILTGEKYVLGTAVTQMTFQIGMVTGFAFGGVVMAALGARPALLADAVTFAASALLLTLWVRRRPAAASRAGQPSPWRDMAAGMRLVFGDPGLRALMLFGWLVAFYVIPMGLAAPYAARFHALPLAVATGLVFAANPFGTAVGAYLLGRRVSPGRRQWLMRPLAVGSCAVLMLCWWQPGFAASLAIFVASGACAAYQVAANAAFVARVPAEHRGQAFGLANGGMQVLQGAWFIAAGALAQRFGPGSVIAGSGLLGAIVAVVLGLSLRARIDVSRPVR
jgi:MFS family permease